MGILIRNMPAITGRVRVKNTLLGPEWLSSSALVQHETMPVDFELRTNKPSTFSLISGILPTGVALNTATGRITGTMPVVPASGINHDIVLRATDTNGKTTDAPLRLSVVGASEGDLYDFPLGHTLHPTYLSVQNNYLSSSYPRLAAKFGVKNASILNSATAVSTLINNPRGSNTAFGYSVACDATGSVIVIGETVGSAITIAKRTGDSFSYTRFTGGNADGLGQCVDINSTGTTAIAGAPSHYNGSYFVGAISIYQNINGAWSRTLNRSNPLNGRMGLGYGSQVCVSPDGSHVATLFSTSNATQFLQVGRLENNTWVFDNLFTTTLGSGIGVSGSSLKFDTQNNLYVPVSQSARLPNGSTANYGFIERYARNNRDWVKTETIRNPMDQEYLEYKLVSFVFNGDFTRMFWLVATQPKAGTVNQQGIVEFVRHGNNWARKDNGTLDLIFNEASSFNAQSIASNSDGDKLFIGLENQNGKGAVLSIAMVEGKWTKLAALQPSQLNVNDNFGSTVAINSAGSLLFAGSSLRGDNIGGVYYSKVSYSAIQQSYVNLPINTVGKNTAVKINPDTSAT